MADFSSLISLKNKYILIIGACGLLGRQICRAVADFGGNVIVSDIDEKLCKDFACSLSNEFNVHSIPFVIDIDSEDSVLNFLDYVNKNSIEIYGLVNNAYPRNKSYGTKYENITFESWRENIDLHLNGYFNITQKISKLMMAQKKGCIVSMGSIYGILGPDFSVYEGTSMTMPAEYSAIKGGIINFTKYIATYLAPYGIRANSVSPGGIFNGQPAEFVENYSKKVPLGRMGNPQDIAGGVVFLLSDLSSYITGQNLVIDGGWSAW